MPDILSIIVLLLIGIVFAVKYSKRNQVKMSLTTKVGTTLVTTNYSGNVGDLEAVKNIHNAAIDTEENRTHD